MAYKQDPKQRRWGNAQNCLKSRLGRSTQQSVLKLQTHCSLGLNPKFIVLTYLQQDRPLTTDVTWTPKGGGDSTENPSAIYQGQEQWREPFLKLGHLSILCRLDASYIMSPGTKWKWRDLASKWITDSFMHNLLWNHLRLLGFFLSLCSMTRHPSDIFDWASFFWINITVWNGVKQSNIKKKAGGEKSGDT